MLQHNFYQSQGGMFSKAGRHTTEKYMVFQKKDEIIGGKRKFLKTGSAITLGVQNNKITYLKKQEEAQKKQNPPIINPPILDQKQITEEQLIEKTKQKNKAELQPFFKQTSREKEQSIRTVRYPPPPAGYYHPKYNGLDPQHHFLWDILKINQNRTQPKKLNENLGDEEEEMTKPIVERPKSYVKGNVEIRKHTSRDNLAMRNTNNPHEERFNYLNVTNKWSKIPRVPSSDIAKQLGRYNAAIYKTNNYAPDYNPNCDVGKPRIDIGQTDFKNSLSRRDMTKRPQTSNENFFNYDYYYQSKDSNIFVPTKAPMFDKQLNRERDQSSPLPSFMQKPINSRIQLSYVNEKMLELNHYMDGRFQTVSTSFKKKPNESPYKKRGKGNDDDLSFDNEDKAF